jgi:hypothetical protein
MAARKRDEITGHLREGLRNGIVLHLHAAAEKAGAEIAQEWLKEPAFKAEMRELAREIAAGLRKR